MPRSRSTGRYRLATELFEIPKRRIASALRESLAEGYGLAKLRQDVLAGLTVSFVALPLSLALAIASGVPPQHGLYTAIIAGGLCPLLGGSRVNVTGTSASFVVLLAPVTAQYGLAGLSLASLLAGLMLCLMGISRLGRLIQFVPHPVTTGFTAGVGLVIAVLQLRDLLGLESSPTGTHFWEKAGDIFRSLGTWHAGDLALGLGTLFILLLTPRITRRVPAPLLAIALATLVGWWIDRRFPGLDFSTIGDRYRYDLGGGRVGPGVPPVPPLFKLPWNLPGPDGRPLVLSFEVLRGLLAPAFAIALLGSIESLLSAVVADSMSGHKHDPDVELVGQGLGNVAASFFGGFAATGAIARTATNVRSGARSPLAASAHALFLLVVVLFLSPVLAHLPMAALAALLIVVAWNMSGVSHFVRIVRIAPRSDLLVLLTCFLLTVVFDMVVSVTVGVVLAALLFMRRMAEMTTARFLLSSNAEEARTLGVPQDVLIYQVGGPLFFGAAERAMHSLARVATEMRAVILELDRVPHMDLTGLVALESVVDAIVARGTRVVLCGGDPKVIEMLEKAGLFEDAAVSLAATTDEALRSLGGTPAVAGVS